MPILQTLRRIFLFSALGLLLPALAPAAANIVPNFPGTNFSVNAITSTATDVYIGGDFTMVGLASGSGVIIDSTNGGLQPGADHWGGTFLVAISDTAGGYYVGGNTGLTVNGQPVSPLVHILNSGKIDPAFVSQANGSVSALALDTGSGFLYVGGSFSSIGGQLRSRLAKLSASTGAADIPFNISANATVSSMLLAGSSLYIGGSFTQVGGVARTRTAKVSTSGLLDASFLCNVNAGTVGTLAFDSAGKLYMGGSTFTNVSGAVRNHVAKVDGATGAIDVTFDCNASSAVNALLLDGLGNLYLGGAFTSVSGVARTAVAKVAAATGITDQSFNANGSGTVYRMALDSLGYLYVGGLFQTMGVYARNNMARLSVSTGNTDAGFDPSVDNTVNALSLQDGFGELFVGGSFGLLGARNRNHLAKFNASTGVVDPSFNPNVADGSVYALALDNGSFLYAGGSFTNVGSQPRSGTVKVSTSSGAVDATYNGGSLGAASVRALAMDSAATFLYAGGDFTTIGGQSRTYLAKLSTVNGNADLSFVPSLDNYLQALAYDPAGCLYIGGAFLTVSSQYRTGTAKVVTSTGAVLTAFNAGIPSGSVQSLSFDGTNVFIGGAFSSVGGQVRNNAAKLLSATGAVVLAYDPNASGSVASQALAGSKQYIGGGFTSIGASTRFNVAKVDKVTGGADPVFDPNTGGFTVWALSFDPARNYVYVGGGFTTLGGYPQPYFAALDETLAIYSSTPTCTFTATPTRTVTPTLTRTGTLSPTPSSTRTVSPTFSRSPSPSPSATRTATPASTPACLAFDPSFGGAGGYVTYNGPISSGADAGNSIARDGSGRLFVCGTAERAPGNTDMALWCLLPGGGLDSSFNGSGVVTYNGPGNDIDSGAAVAIDSNGKIVVGGYIASAGAVLDGAVWRFNPDGSADTSFNGTGFEVVDLGFASDAVYGMALDSSNRIILCGHTGGSTGPLKVARLLASGGLDPSFGSAGIFTYSTEPSIGFGVKVDGSGRILVTGYRTIASLFNALTVWRLTSAGALDGTFGGGAGLVSDGSLAEPTQGSDVIEDPAGRIVAVGYAYEGSGYDVLVSRWDGNGNVDASFGSGGRVLIGNGITGYFGAQIRADALNRYYVTGQTDDVPSSTADMALWRLLQTGTVDRQFTHDNAAGGANADVGTGLLLGPSGSIFVAGSSDNTVFFGADLAVWNFIVCDPPAATPTPTFTPSASASPTAVPLAPGFGFTSFGNGSYDSLNQTGFKTDARFAQRGNKNLSQFGVYVLGLNGLPPQYKISVYPDNGFGEPGPSPLYGLTTAFSVGWNSFSAPNLPLVDGSIYHVVVEAGAVPPDAGNYMDVFQSFGQRAWTIDQVYDPLLAGGFDSGGSWSYSAGPMVILAYSDSSVDGGSFHTFGGAFAYGSTQAAQRFKAPAGGAWVSRLGVRASKIGSPMDSLHYRIYNVTQALVVDSGIFATAAGVTGGWLDHDLNQPIFLNAADDYRFEFSSPGTDASNLYAFDQAYNGGGPTTLNLYTFGGTAQYAETSFNGGASFSGDPTQDAFFRFNFGLVPTPTDTPSRTPVPSATFSATASPTASPSATATPSPSPSATATTTPCDLTLSTSMTLSAGTYSYCSIHILSGGALFISGTVQLYASSGDFVLDAGGLVSGTGLGTAGPSIQQNGGGLGGGGFGNGAGGAGGGGYGGPGGNGSNYLNGGGVFGSASNPNSEGSAGGSGNTGLGGAGGAYLLLAVSGNSVINGQLTFGGAPGNNSSATPNLSAGGGGSGGTLYLSTVNLSGSGLVSARGGAGGSSGCGGANCWGGGGGGGGRVNFCVSGGDFFSGSVNVGGGIAGSGVPAPGAGGGGTFYRCSVPGYTPTSTVTATPTTSHTSTATPTFSATATISLTSTHTPTRTPSSSNTVTVSPTFSHTSTATPSFSSTPTLSPTFSHTATVTPSFSSTATLSPTFSHTSTATPSFSGTTTASPTFSHTSTATPSSSHTATVSPTFSGTPTATPSFSRTPTVSPSFSPTSTLTPSFSPSLTVSPTFSHTPTGTPSSSQTASPTPSSSPTDSLTPTPSRTATVSPSQSSTPTGTPTASVSATSSSTATVTAPNSPTFTGTASPTRTQTPLPSASATGTGTPMPSFTATPTLFVTQTSTGTISPTWTVSDTPQPSATAVVPLVLDRNIFRPESGLPLAINFKPESAGRVTVRIFNVAGESVRMPFQGDVAAGAWIQANWDGSNDFGEKVAAGIYVISVKGGGIKSLKKVVLLK